MKFANYLSLLLFSAVIAPLSAQTPDPACPRFSNVHDMRRADMDGSGSLKAPKVIYEEDPQYSEEARHQKISGEVLVSFVVDVDGKPKCIQVVKPLGYGLDEKAVEAVSQWRFSPATREDKPIPVQMRASVSFHIYRRR